MTAAFAIQRDRAGKERGQPGDWPKVGGTEKGGAPGGVKVGIGCEKLTLDFRKGEPTGLVPERLIKKIVERVSDIGRHKR